MNSPVKSDAVAVSPVPTARTILKQLQECFSVFRDCQPLAIGIDKQIIAAIPDIDRKQMRVALHMHVRSKRYLKNMSGAKRRFDLSGSAVADVTEEHRKHALDTLKERMRKEADAKRAQAAAEREAEVAERRGVKLQELAAKFAKR